MKQPAKVESKPFVEEIAKSLLEDTCSHIPLFGTYLGLPEYNTQMPDGSIDVLNDFKKKLNRHKDSLCCIPVDSLSEEESLNREILLNSILSSLYQMNHLPTTHGLPDAPFIVGESIFKLLQKNYAPLKKRLKDISERIAKTPDYIERSKTVLTTPVKIYCQTILEINQTLPNLLKLILSIAKKEFNTKELRTLKSNIAKLDETISSYNVWLKKNINKAKNDYVISEDTFNKLLALKGIDMEWKEMLAFGEKKFNELQNNLNELAKKIDKKKTTDEVIEFIKSQHPKSFKEVLEYVKKETAKARRWVKESDFADIPEGESLEVTETPTFLRPVVPFGAYSPPGRFDKHQKGFYYVTPGDASKLKEHNYPSLKNMTIHEGYPGHHLQFVCTNKNPHLSRIFAEGMDLCEGWAHYCEEEVKNMGYDVTDENIFIQTLDMLWRAVRIIVDVKLSTGKMSIQQAVSFMKKNLQMGDQEAFAEVKRYTFSHAYQLCYLYGKETLKKIKKEVENKMQTEFKSKTFHNLVLQAGTIQLKFFRKEVSIKLGL